MIFKILHQEKYSRGELILRTLLGAIYIGIPHGVVLFFVGIWFNVKWFVWVRAVE